MRLKRREDYRRPIRCQPRTGFRCIVTEQNLLTAAATAMTDTLAQAGFDAEVQQNAAFTDFQESIETKGGVGVLNVETF